MLASAMFLKSLLSTDGRFTSPMSSNPPENFIDVVWLLEACDINRPDIGWFKGWRIAGWSKDRMVHHWGI
jgi:hypothetical protein